MTRPFHRYTAPASPEPGARDSRGELGRYDPEPETIVAVNTALAAGQPLLVTGEPGTGKTALAWSVAEVLGLPPPELFVVRSDSQAHDALYDYDAVARLRDAQLQDERARTAQPYIRLRALGRAIAASARGQERVVLFDEIDKAPRDFPNDLLHELDQMRFSIAETGQEVIGRHDCRPVVIVTSNEERTLPAAFLRRCVYLSLPFPSEERLRRILRLRLGLGAAPGGPGGGGGADPDSAFVDQAVAVFSGLRTLTDDWEKRPSTSELIAWARVLRVAGVDAAAIRDRLGSTGQGWRGFYEGALVKTSADLDTLHGLG